MPGPRDGTGIIRDVGSRAPVNRNPRFPAFPFPRKRRCKSMYSTNRPKNVLPNKMRGVRGKGRRRYLSRPLFPIRDSSAKNPPAHPATPPRGTNHGHSATSLIYRARMSALAPLANCLSASGQRSIISIYYRGSPCSPCGNPAEPLSSSATPATLVFTTDPVSLTLLAPTCYDVTRRHHGPNC